MKSVVQRVARAEVRVDGTPVGRIEAGFVVLVAVERGDPAADVELTAHKVGTLRVFPGRTPMDRTLAEIAAQLATDESAVGALTTAVAGKQPLDADLTAIAALTSWVRSMWPPPKGSSSARSTSRWCAGSMATFATSITSTPIVSWE